MNKNTLEWTVFGISLVLIGAVVSLLLHQHFTVGDTPPSILMSAGEAVETEGGYAVPVDIRNEGDLTAEEVRVEVTLTWPGGIERGEAAVSIIPYRSQRRVWIAFTRDPRGAGLKSRVLGYSQP